MIQKYDKQWKIDIISYMSFLFIYIYYSFFLALQSNLNFQKIEVIEDRTVRLSLASEYIILAWYPYKQ